MKWHNNTVTKKRSDRPDYGLYGEWCYGWWFFVDLGGLRNFIE